MSKLAELLVVNCILFGLVNSYPFQYDFYSDGHVVESDWFTDSETDDEIVKRPSVVETRIHSLLRRDVKGPKSSSESSESQEVIREEIAVVVDENASKAEIFETNVTEKRPPKDSGFFGFLSNLNFFVDKELAKITPSEIIVHTTPEKPEKTETTTELEEVTTHVPEKSRRSPNVTTEAPKATPSTTSHTFAPNEEYIHGLRRRAVSNLAVISLTKAPQDSSSSEAKDSSSSEAKDSSSSEEKEPSSGSEKVQSSDGEKVSATTEGAKIEESSTTEAPKVTPHEAKRELESSTSIFVTPLTSSTEASKVQTTPQSTEAKPVTHSASTTQASKVPETSEAKPEPSTQAPKVPESSEAKPVTVSTSTTQTPKAQETPEPKPVTPLAPSTQAPKVQEATSAKAASKSLESVKHTIDHVLHDAPESVLMDDVEEKIAEIRAPPVILSQGL